MALLDVGLTGFEIGPHPPQPAPKTDPSQCFHMILVIGRHFPEFNVYLAFEDTVCTLAW